MVALDDVQQRNFRASRDVFDAWYTGPDADREAWWVRLVAALWTESGCRILAHTGTWGGGGWINDAQKAVLKTSSQYPHDGFGSNGGSVGALQQIPTPVAQLATDQFTGKSKAWGGWGTIPDCMALETSVPKFLAQLRVTNNTYYGSKPMADPIVADLLRVQQPLESEVDANYGASIVSTAKQVAALYPRTEPTVKEWSDMATREEFVSALREVLLGDEFQNKLVGRVHDDLVGVLRAPEFSQIKSAVNGVDYPATAIAAWTDMHTSNIEAATKFLVEQAGGVAVPSADHEGNFSYKKGV